MADASTRWVSLPLNPTYDPAACRLPPDSFPLF